MSKVIDLLMKKNDKNNNEIDDNIALLSRDPNHKYKGDHPYFKIASILNEKTKTIDGFKVTYDQDYFLEKLNRKNVFMAQAGTGFGKTWLISNTFNSNSDGSYLHIVPNDVLVSQGLWQVGDLGTENFEFDSKKYILATPEKTFGNIERVLDNIERFEKIIFDEAHMLFGNDDHRSNFYKFVFRKLFSHKTDNQQFVLLSPFLTKENIQEIKDICGDVEFQEFEGFTSEYLIKSPETNTYLANYSNSQIEEKNSRINGIDLHFYTSSKKAREKFEEDIKVDYIENSLTSFINKISKNDEIYDAYKECSASISAIVNYDLIWGLSMGIALYHGNVPNAIKKLIFVLAKNNMLRKIHGTQALLNGADLQIRKIVIDNTYTHRKMITVNDFWNLAGRSGRYSPGSERIFGVIEFERNNNNIRWFEKNKTEISRGNKKTLPYVEGNELKWFTNQSIEEAKNNPMLKSVLLSDPRINPKVTVELYENKETAYSFLENVLKLINLKYELNDNLAWEDQTEALKLIEPIFKFYETSKPSGGWDFYDVQKEEYDKLKAIRIFVKWFSLYDEKKILSAYSWYYFKQKITSDSSMKFEKFVGIFKNKTKYEILLVLNHVFLINKEIGNINFDLYDILNLETKNLQLISYIKKNKLDDKYKEFRKKGSKRFKYINRYETLEGFKEYLAEQK